MNTKQIHAQQLVIGVCCLLKYYRVKHTLNLQQLHKIRSDILIINNILRYTFKNKNRY